MTQILQTDVFANWLENLRDRKAKARIDLRLARAALGNLGDIKSVGSGLYEMRIDYGQGYRLYFCWRGKASERTLIVLLCGGDKSTQARDMEKAKNLAANLEEG